MRNYLERGWASLACAGLAGLAVLAVPRDASIPAPQAVLGDFSLLSLVFLFRAMKLRNMRALAQAQWILIVLLAASFVLLLAITVAWPSIAAGAASD